MAVQANIGRDMDAAAALLDSVTSPLATIDGGGRLVAFNRGFTLLVAEAGRQAEPGQPLVDAVGERFAEVWLSSADRARVDGETKVVALGWGTAHRNLDLILRRGREGHVHAELHPLQAGGADPGAAPFDALLQNVTEMVFVVDPELRVRGFNSVFGAGAQVVLGRPLQVGDPVRSMVAPANWPSMEAAYRRALAGESLLLDQPVELASGLSRIYETSLNPLREGGKVTGVVGISRNITERKLDEEATRRLARDRRAIFETIPDSITVVRRDGRIIDFKADAASPSLMQPKEFVGHNISEFNGPLFVVIRAHLTTAFETGQLVSFEYELTVDGRLRTRDTRVKTIDADTALIIVRDVTEQRDLAQRLVEADRMASLGTLSAGIGHELNNPLMIVMSNLQVAREELTGLGHVELQTALTAAAEAAERMRRIIRDLRDFSRQDNAPGQEGSPQRAAQLALNLLQTTMSAKARVFAELPETGLVPLSEGRLSQVLLNLLVNAAQCFDKERDTTLNEVRLRVASRDTDVIIEVSDNGPGIPREILGRIFDPFFTTKPVGAGTGLGLSLAHGIVTGVGGRLDVESTVGVGTTFTISLPQRLAPRVATAVASRSRVLLIDDDEHVRRALAALLRRDHAVTAVGGAIPALELLGRGEVFDLILCDVLMPDLNGVELIRRARQLPMAGKPPQMVLMSGGIFDAQLLADIDALQVPLLNKPFDREEFARLLGASAKPG